MVQGALLVARPVFPQGRRARAHHAHKRGHVLARQKTIGQIGLPFFKQHARNDFRADNARVEPAQRLVMRDHPRQGAAVAQADIHSERVRALEIAAEIARHRVEILRGHRGLRLFDPRRPVRVLRQAQQRFHARDNLQRTHKAIGVDERRIELRTAGRKPVAQAPLARPVADDEISLAVRGQVVDVTAHAGIGGAKRLHLAVMPVILPRHHHNRAAPAAGAAAVARVGRGILHMAGIAVLTIENIVQPFAQEGFVVEREQRRFGGQLTVAGVALALKMRAVRRDAAVQVHQLRAHKRVVEPRQRLAGAAEGRRHRHVAVNDRNRLHLRPAVDREAAEAVPRRARMQHAAAPVADDAEILILHEPLVQRSDRIDRLGEAHLDPLARAAFILQHNPAGDILARIVNFQLRRFGDQPRRNLPDHPVRRAGLQKIFRLHRRQNADGPPSVIGRKRPIRRAAVQILLFAAEELAPFHDALVPAQLFAGEHFVFASIRRLVGDAVAEPHLAEGDVPVERPHRLGKETGGQLERQLVLALAPEGQQIIFQAIAAMPHLLVERLAVDCDGPPDVIARGRHEQIVGNPPPVEIHRKIPQSADRYFRPARRVRPERRAQHRRARNAVAPDPFGSPEHLFLFHARKLSLMQKCFSQFIAFLRQCQSKKATRFPVQRKRAGKTYWKYPITRFSAPGASFSATAERKLRSLPFSFRQTKRPQ